MKETHFFHYLKKSKRGLDRELQPDGYNIGINDGQSAGQTGLSPKLNLAIPHDSPKSQSHCGIR